MVKWNSNFAYAIGLFTADGNISPDGRHLEFCSKDLELVRLLKKCFNLKNKITRKHRGSYPKKWYHRVQFGNKELYKFFLEIGLTPNKSRSLVELKVPKKYFSDFLRGLLDGDGNIDISKHPESRHPQLKARFSSGSIEFLTWLKKRIYEIFGISGYMTDVKRAFYLNYAKQNSIILFNKIYYRNKLPCLARKFKIAEQFLKKRTWRNWYTRKI